MPKLPLTASGVTGRVSIPSPIVSLIVFHEAPLTGEAKNN